MRNGVSLVRPKCLRALRAAALALPMAVWFAAPAAAEPTVLEDATWNAPPGVLIQVFADDVFDDAGTNPRITGAAFYTTEYYSVHQIDGGKLEVQPKTDAELSALSPPPPSPFLVDATVTMANDEGQTAEGTITIRTTYDRTALEQPGGEPPAPTISEDATWNAPPGILIQVFAESAFDNAGTNPRITDAVFSATKYFSVHQVSRDRLWAWLKTDAQLSALSPPPPSPFTVDVAVTMANDEGQTASGTITLRATYNRTEPGQPGGEPPAPAISEDATWNAPPGVMIQVLAESAFDNAGTNPRIIAAELPTAEYHSVLRFDGGKVWIQSMTAEELNALPTPPPSPFAIKVTVTMTNDESQTASGTLTVETEYERTGGEGE